MSLNHKILTKIILFSASVGTIIFFALYNGYPLVFYDTAIYIVSGMELYVPDERPIIYGLFIRYVSLQQTLWTVIVLQAVFAVYVLYEFIKIFYKKNYEIITFVTVLILSFTTGLSFVASEILPDIFTPISIILLFLILFGKYSTAKRSVLCFLYLLSLVMHLSNFMISISVLIALCLVNLLYKLYCRNSFLDSKKVVLSFTLAISSYFVVSSIHYIYGAEFGPPRCSSKFIMGSLCQHGILGEILSDKCPGNPGYSKLCPYRDNLPDNSHFFLYGNESPFKKIGYCADNKDDFLNIVKDTLISPKYLKLHFVEAFKAVYDQLLMYQIKVYRLTRYNNLDNFIHSYFYSEYDDYLNSRQQKNTLNVDMINHIQHLLILVSVLIIAGTLVYRKTRSSLSDLQKISILFVVIALIANAFVTGYLSGIVNRYQNRVIWLIPLVAICLLKPLYNEYKRLFANDPEKR